MKIVFAEIIETSTEVCLKPEAITKDDVVQVPFLRSAERKDLLRLQSCDGEVNRPCGDYLPRFKKQGRHLGMLGSSGGRDGVNARKTQVNTSSATRRDSGTGAFSVHLWFAISG